MRFLQFINEYWMMITGVLALAFAIAFLWLKSKFAARSELDLTVTETVRIEGKLDSLESKVDNAVNDLERWPSRQQLFEKIQTTDQAVAELRGEFGMLNKQIATLNSYLHTIVEQRMQR